MTRSIRDHRVLLGLAIFLGSVQGNFNAAENAGQRPNILWLSCEDISPHIGCYGDSHAITPHIDQLASEGVRYSHCFTIAGVCAPNRSGIITGMYQTTLGTHHMRCEITLPPYIQPFPVYLRQTGYYCTNNSKTDYQFKHPSNTWDASNRDAHWRNRPDTSQPFFAVFNFIDCHESRIASTAQYKRVTRVLTPDQRQDPRAITTFPDYYPDTPVAREDWKRNYELITAMDHWAGNLIQQLKDDGFYENTIIFFWSDHGIGLPRAKRWLYDSGTHVPLIVRTPESLQKPGQRLAGTVSDRLVSSIDFGPTVLHLAEVDVPSHVQGKPFLGPLPAEPRAYVYGSRDRMDERYDIIRMVRNKRYKYIRNYEPLKTYYQYMNTPEKGATMKELRRLHDEGKLDATADRYFSDTKPVEELYDTMSDPQELTNLAGSREHSQVLKEMRTAHLKWVLDTRDLGLIAEPILVDLEKQAGSRYEILRTENDKHLAQRIATAAVSATEGPDSIEKLANFMNDSDAAVRYWGATGLGNIGAEASAHQDLVTQHLSDPSVPVRVAAARALCRMGHADDALATITAVLSEGEQWERLQAAIVLDEIDELAIPVIQEMHAALNPQSDLFAGGKYVVRVINRALNQLEGTTRTVR
ncbi:MAG: sulfatase [Planctomycetaceae bacterium]|nr:sulfatase [Planctomycetaceae bacterium]